MNIDKETDSESSFKRYSATLSEDSVSKHVKKSLR